MKKKAKNILIIIAVTIGILGVLEMASRLILSRIYNRQFDSSLVEEHKYGPTSGLKANATGNVWGKPFHTDDMGGRKATKNKKGKPKLLLIGDSVTEGVGVEDSSTFANLLNDHFDTFDIRNISMIGWSSADYRNVVDTLLKTDSTIKYICILYCLNDIYSTHRTKELPVMGNKKWLGKLNKLLQSSYATYKLIKLCLSQNSDNYFRYDEALYHDKTMVDSSVADLVHINDACQGKGVGLELLILPYRSQLQQRERNLPQQVLIDKLRALDFNLADLMRCKQVNGYLTGIETKGKSTDLYLFGDEIHFSEKGHKAVADVFASK